MRISPSIVILLGVVNDTFGAVAPSQGSSTLAIASKTKTNMQATNVARMARPPGKSFHNPNYSPFDIVSNRFI